MGQTVEAVIQIVSDDEEIPPAVKPPGDALHRDSQFLLEDIKEFEDSINDCPGMQAFLASLEGETERACDGDGDDDDCVMLDGDPAKPVVVSMEKKPGQDDSDQELQIIAEKGECHCYVCESRAPCPKWGTGTLPTDHCHATENDKKWKDLRISFRRKGLPAASKRKRILNNLGAISTTPSSQQRNVLDPQPLHNSGTKVIPHAGRVPVASIVSQNQQRHLFRAAQNADIQPLPHWGTTVSQPYFGRVPVASNVSQNQPSHLSIGAAQNAVQGVHLPKASAQGPTVTGKRVKTSGAAPTVYTPPSNAYYLHSSLLNNTTFHPASSRVFQTTQVAPGSNIVAGSVQARTPQQALNAPPLSHRIQAQPASHLRVAPNKAVVTGQQRALQCAQYSSGNLLQKSWQDDLANVASRLGVSEYNTNPPHGQQSTSTQSLYPSQLFTRVRASQGSATHRNNVPATSQMRHSSGIRLPNLNSGFQK